MKFDEAQELIIEEYIKATNKFPSMYSAHDGYAIILEELDELWSSVKLHGNPITATESNTIRKAIKVDGVRVGAMALRFLVDCC